MSRIEKKAKGEIRKELIDVNDNDGGRTTFSIFLLFLCICDVQSGRNAKELFCKDGRKLLRVIVREEIES